MYSDATTPMATIEIEHGHIYVYPGKRAIYHNVPPKGYYHKDPELIEALEKYFDALGAFVRFRTFCYYETRGGVWKSFPLWVSISTILTNEEPDAIAFLRESFGGN